MKQFQLCFAPFVFGDYSRYIPLYIYSILKTYPEYYVKIFFRDSLAEKEKQSLDFLRNNLSHNFEVVENFYNNISISHFKLLRWLIKEEFLLDFENVYFGDVDFLILKDKIPILESHLDHCSKINLPYSNIYRGGKDKYNKRMTGLHFVKRKEYYEKMNNEISYYLKNLNELKKFENLNPSPNEKFLYHLLEKNIGFGDLDKVKSWRPHHGLHLGYFVKGKINHRISIEHLLKMKKKVCEFLNDKLFIDLIKILDDKILDLDFNLMKKIYL